jgi:hypothetical protein
LEIVVSAKIASTTSSKMMFEVCIVARNVRTPSRPFQDGFVTRAIASRYQPTEGEPKGPALSRVVREMPGRSGRLALSAASGSLVAHGLAIGLVLQRTPSHPPQTVAERSASELNLEAPRVDEEPAAAPNPDGEHPTMGAAPPPSHGHPEESPKPTGGIGYVPIGRDAPDLLEQIQRQIASWGPQKIVRDGIRPASWDWKGNDFLKGQLPPKLIAGVVRWNLERFRACDRTAIATTHGIVGDVRVAFVIAPDGAVVDARDAGGTFPDAAVRRCVIAALARLTFPRPPSGKPQPVTYAIELPANEAPGGRSEAGEP